MVFSIGSDAGCGTVLGGGERVLCSCEDVGVFVGMPCQVHVDQHENFWKVG